jgi:hypothetical protein
MKINIGDILAVELENKMYMFFQIMYQIPRKNNKKEIAKITPQSRLIDDIKWYPGFFIINVYKQISKEKVLQNKEIMFKGVFAPSDMKDYSFEIIGHEKIQVEDVEFPETLGANKEEGYFIQRGELKLYIRDWQKIEKELHNAPSTGYRDFYSLADSVLFLQNRKNEMQGKYFDGWKFYPNDLKYFPELRNTIYSLIGEDAKQSYYNIALKHGFDLAKLYK